MKRIPLTQGKFALVDDEDFEYLNKFKWYAHKKRNGDFYVRRASPRVDMHRLVLGTPKGFVTDHIDCNGLNNQRNNLRVCNNAQNQYHQKIRKKNKTSVYKGVYWHKKSKKWLTKIKASGKFIYLGIFLSEKQAAFEYNKAAKKYHGEFAYFNKI